MTNESVAFAEFKAADKAWSAELKRVFGKNAGDARYDERGISTVELRLFHAAFMRARDAWRKEA